MMVECPACDGSGMVHYARCCMKMGISGCCGEPVVVPSPCGLCCGDMWVRDVEAFDYLLTR